MIKIKNLQFSSLTSDSFIGLLSNASVVVVSKPPVKKRKVSKFKRHSNISEQKKYIDFKFSNMLRWWILWITTESIIKISRNIEISDRELTTFFIGTCIKDWNTIRCGCIHTVCEEKKFQEILGNTFKFSNVSLDHDLEYNFGEDWPSTSSKNESSPSFSKIWLTRAEK